MGARQFLEEIQLRPAQTEIGAFEPIGLALGNGKQALEVLVVRAGTVPAAGAIRKVWAERNGGRAAPLLVAVLVEDRCILCGPGGDNPPVSPLLDAAQAERICLAALEAPDRHAARRLLQELLPTLEQDVPGLRNAGLFATHELFHGARALPEWETAETKARGIRGRPEGAALLQALDFELEHTDRLINFLYARGKRRAAAVVLNASEAPEADLDRFSGQSPVAYALHIADREGLPYVIVTQKGRLRLYPTAIDAGVGRRGRTETFVELNTDVLSEELAAYLWLLFSADALCEGGTIERLLADSERYAGDLAENLRERVYHKVVPALAEALIAARDLQEPTERELDETYRMTMLVLFRLLFIGYAEDKDLLPYRWNEAYRARSLTQKALELLAQHEEGTAFDDDDSLWQETMRIFHAIDRGRTEWGIPVYNGGLFTSDVAISPIGHALESIALPNTAFGPVLRDLLLMDTAEGLGPVDFRSLGVREFGTIYEGLLESELAAAPEDLAVDKDGSYRPAKKKDAVVVARGEVFLHRSGQRKSTGSYFTPSYIVDHLLDMALEPALRDHLARLEALDDDEAARALFDFRITDIACGSGHFLIGAIDRIERAFSGFLAERNLAAVRKELADLAGSARRQLGRLEDEMPIEDGQLLRRLIARRCIYGVDMNPVAVQLARLAVWVHTFVPGLPLSLLDHNLVCGNSLVGIGDVGEIEDALAGDEADLFSISTRELVGDAMESLERLGRIADASATELDSARDAHEAARNAILPAKHLCDLVTATRLEGEDFALPPGSWTQVREEMEKLASEYASVARLSRMNPLHFPVAFPEVFLRERPGFDVILGNPPWEEATVEEDAFWARHRPGLRGLKQREQEELKKDLQRTRPDLAKQFEAEKQQAETLRKALMAGPYPGMGTGDPDLYKAFCWRFWGLLAEGGRFGVVLPRSALIAKGSTEFRQRLFSSGGSVEITMLLNNRQWVFSEVHPQYTIGLCAFRKAPGETTSIELRGPFHSRDRFERFGGFEGERFDFDEIGRMSASCALPLLPDARSHGLPADRSRRIMSRMSEHPALGDEDAGDWSIRLATEFHATNDKKHFDMKSVDCPDGFWPVYKGASFDLWTPDTGTYYGWADPEHVVPVLEQKRARASRNSRSAFNEMPEDWINDKSTLPCLHPRIAFRDITNRTNTRTCVAALLPPDVVCVNAAPYLLWPRGSQTDEAFLLGVMSSLPFDWYARRFVETHLNYHVLYPLPVPRPAQDDPLRLGMIRTAGRLAAVDERYADWASAIGVEFGPLDEAERERLIHRVDALSARLYGLDPELIEHLFATFHEGWDHRPRLEAVLAQYHELESESAR
ncbi:hypothetical protein HFP89_08115 [Wenzhouxiangella sp. XN79A]|uniref:Eco57I restriction-modification methylase domain-containing protein n=1 Tax=Wenzhouxiangella sp. XN79A TaxID=2724193 RepID=UPI00144A6C0F|nr:hypothetical protein [Wenzhouxiangella sp. XN79A]NKI35129.1 hypothetical protein [Wenzhouxiangella sp. XN79A]